MEVREINDWDAELIGYDKPLLPDGKFEAVLVCHETAFFFQSAKVFLRFRIVSLEEGGRYFGVEIFRAYRAAKLWTSGLPRIQ